MHVFFLHVHCPHGILDLTAGMVPPPGSCLKKWFANISALVKRFVGFSAGQEKQVNLQNANLILFTSVCYNSCSQFALHNTNLCGR